MSQIQQKKKKLLAKNSTLSTNKNTDDNDNNVAMHIKKNTTINLNAARVNQTMSNDCIAKALCDDTFIRKKYLITFIVNNVNKHAAGSHWKMAC